jgi:hypothetical protein
LVGYVELQGVFPRHFSPNLSPNRLSSIHFLCTHNNVSREHLILGYRLAIENNIRWYFMTISSYAKDHPYTLLFINCASSFNFFCTFNINSVISRHIKIHHRLVCIFYMLKRIVLFLP